MDLIKYKRLRDHEDMYDDEDSDWEDRPHKIRATSMAKIMNISNDNHELLHFYLEHTSPILVLVTGEKDSSWMGAVPQRSRTSPALAQACQVFAKGHQFHNKNPYRYLLKGERPYLKARGKPRDMSDVIGYVPMLDEELAQVMVGFNEALTKLRGEIETLDETGNYESVLTAAVIVAICAMGAGRFIPLVNFEGSGDLFSILGMVKTIEEVHFGRQRRAPMDIWKFQVPVPGRLSLPHEEGLWDIVSLVGGVTAEERRVRNILQREIHTLTELYNLDLETSCVTHMTAWSTFWQPEFGDLKDELNPYALLIICYWCAYVHSYHSLFWWGDRLQEDLYCIVDNLPEELLSYVEWPLLAVTNFEHDYLDWIRKKRG